MGENSLNQTYEQAMERINCQGTEFRALAPQALSWITLALRPLFGGKLLHPLAVRTDTLEFDQDYLPNLDDIVSSCAGLVIYSKDNDRVSLVHHTTQTYFDKTSWFTDAQWSIANT
jgi:hypothetical protein